MCRSFRGELVEQDEWHFPALSEVPFPEEDTWEVPADNSLEVSVEPLIEPVSISGTSESQPTTEYYECNSNFKLVFSSSKFSAFKRFK